MSKMIQTLSQKYKEGIQRQQIQAESSQKGKIALQKLNILAESFIRLMIEVQTNDEDIVGLSQAVIKDRSRKLLEHASKNHKIENLSLMIGQYVYDEVVGNAQYAELQRQLIQKPQPIPILEEEDSQENKYTFTQGESIFSLSIEKSKSHQIFVENPHLIKVNTYLKTIEMPQAQLTYLCHEMGWTFNFIQGPLIEEHFEIKVVVNFSFKKTVEVLTESYKAKQKRLGKMAASLKMLQRIYLNFPQIWDIYQQIRITKALIVPRDQRNSLQQIGSKILKQQIGPIAQKKQEAENQLLQEQEYLANIDNFKSEQTLMIQHNPGIFTLFPIQKIEISKVPQLWRVKGEMFVNYNGKEKLFQKISQNANSKNAQKAIAQMLVTSIYSQYKQILRKMIMLKTKKSIKT